MNLNNISQCSIQNDGSKICSKNMIIQKMFNNLEKNEQDNVLKINEQNNKLDSNNISENNKIKIINKTAENCGCDGDNIKNITDKEVCIYNKLQDNLFIDLDKDIEIIKNETFKPFQSKKLDSWLDNSNIDQIQEQLFNKYKNYYYSNIHMIDFVMINPRNTLKKNILDLNEIDFINELDPNPNSNKKLTDNGPIKFFGIVFNTAPSSSQGLHWYSIFLDFSTTGSQDDPWKIEYFNSSGYDVRNDNFNRFWLQLEMKCKLKLNKVCKYTKVTNIQHQKPTTGVCGLYSLYYIMSRLDGVPHTHFNEKNIVDDDLMEELRSKLFRNIE